MKYSERHDLYPNTIIISYPFNAGGMVGDRRLWMSEYNSGIEDYHTQAHLIQAAKDKRLPYVVLRWHRDNTATVIEQSPPAS